MSSTSSFQKTFLLYGPLPVKKLAAPDNGELWMDGSTPLTIQEATQGKSDLSFPPTFMWGAATAAYQIEGGLRNCNWSRWEDQKTRQHDGQPTVEHHETAVKACRAWEMFDTDLEHMKKLGMKMYRFSVEWSRIEPACGSFDATAVERYQSWCQQLVDAGIEPMVTLHHFTEPAWFVEKEGWENRDNLQFFQRFVIHITQALAPHCRYWTTINELNGYAICGWIAGVHPPGKVNDLFGMLRVARHLLVAHTLAAAAIRASSAVVQKQDPVICLALNHVYFLPFDSNQHPIPTTSPLALLAWLLNRLLSTIVSLFLNYVYNFVFLDAIFSQQHAGRFPLFPFPFHIAALLAGWNDDIANLKGSADWIGVNHYYRSYVQFGRTRGSTTSTPQQASPTDMFIALPVVGMELRATAIANFEKNEMGWDLTPSSMERLLRILADRYPNVPIIITESGTADTTDTKRVRYIAAILRAMYNLMNNSNNDNNTKAVDIRGYLIWTLMDNFEWAEGYRPKFGLLETNFETLERTERKLTCDMLRKVFCQDASG
ncbi:2H-1,4-benzoxazin-2-yl glucoside beta-D-glucosidase [Seminavis robusta]|uniref:2H-1,4-benzoxazin-2-yl glucoside beta-D-glucosidase n=1 Tax=Seminavis robusta TaxID=568900 RepID=A0A9N8DU16_9STRA|nr:2H-1,4-benzoxazin-2-yl glucoside beta-D-glucosidase [Seminavis robusta]|eukprot:Sro351_g123940.1 2H-1,4-benzoxazin-2-yl glucoside beta-D-glucosidase (544) ;mRNA; r:33834-35465